MHGILRINDFSFPIGEELHTFFKVKNTVQPIHPSRWWVFVSWDYVLYQYSIWLMIQLETEIILNVAMKRIYCIELDREVLEDGKIKIEH